MPLVCIYNTPAPVQRHNLALPTVNPVLSYLQLPVPDHEHAWEGDTASCPLGAAQVCMLQLLAFLFQLLFLQVCLSSYTWKTPTESKSSP